MYMNVLPVYGRYRGISRTLIIPKIKSGQDWDDLFNDFEQYVAWRIAGGRVYRWGMFQILCKLCAGKRFGLYCFGGDKRDRTADLMTASCDQFVILSVFTSNPSVPSTKSAGFCKVLSIASTRFRAHLGHNLGQFSAAGYSLQSRR